MLTLHDPGERFREAFLLAVGDYVRSGEMKSISRYQRAVGDFAGYLRSLLHTDSHRVRFNIGGRCAGYP